MCQREKAIHKFTKVNVYETGKTGISIQSVPVTVLNQKFTKAVNLRSPLQKWAGRYIMEHTKKAFTIDLNTPYSRL